ncbi:hypothetical protein EX895_002439 [Sporisorium graminicola]|uniref:ABC transporter domain-containing protein n=1 Tax=Sporisorium graminicola TaxID=280036 RepID=A0A4U7KZC6_9BASI|nr:hypothetical protein EX895_002439 [Sporisorium graminicola]TKY88808.1 hypothetical protein EX895_002439 [Sporisorium graminicola]
MHLADHIVQIRSGGTVDMLTSEAVTVSKLADDIGVLRRGAAEHRGSNEVTNGDSSSAALVRNAVAKEPGDPESEDEHEEVLIGRIKLSVFKRYFRAAGWCALWYPLAVVMQTGFANGQLLWLQAWAKNVSEDTLPGSIGMHIGILVLLVLGRFVTYAGSLLIYLLLFCPKISLQLHHDLLNGVLLSGADFFLNLNPGRMINRFTQDVFALDFQICTYVVNVALFVINLGYSLVLMMLPAPYLVGVIVAMAALYFLIYRLYSPSSRQLRRLEMATKSSLHSQFRETGDVQGLLTIRASQLGLHFSRTTAFLLDMSQRPYYSLWAVRVWLQTWLNMLAMVLNTGLVLFAVSLRHTSSSGLVAVALVQAISLSSDLNGLMSAWTDLEIGVVSLERIEQVITLPADPKDTPARFQEMPSTVKGNTTPAAVAVRFEDVTAGYQGRDGPMSLHKVSFDLKPGERLGICGRSGSGKSTLVLSLLRILEPASGRITIDGVDISTYTGSSVRQGISYVPQEPIVLPSLTVRENLDPDCEQSDDQAFWKVLGQTAMSETVSQLPEGLDSPVDLQSLSMGQKQLLNVARALLKRRGLWVLDEATSSLDLETDAQIQLALAGATLDDKGDYGNKVPRAQSKKRAGVICNDRDSTFDATLPGPSRPTLITVAHRLSTIMDYDKILVLGGAKVLEFGSPSELLQLENGEFKTMVEEQNRSIR